MRREIVFPIASLIAYWILLSMIPGTEFWSVLVYFNEAFIIIVSQILNTFY